MHNPTKTCWRVLNIIIFHNKPIQGCLRYERGSCVFFDRDYVGILWAKRCKTLGARYERVSVTSRHQSINIWVAKRILAKRRPSVNARRAGSQLSAGYLREKNMRSATPWALTWSCINAGTTKINYTEARSLTKQLQQKWRSNSIWWGQGKMLKPK